MAKRTRQWASQFTWDDMADQMLSMLRAEAGRLTQSPNNRRTITDLATVVRVPVDLLPDGEVPGFRGTDKCVLSPGELVVLLRNTDTETARVALRVGPASAFGDRRRAGAVRRGPAGRSGVARRRDLAGATETDAARDALAG